MGPIWRPRRKASRRSLSRRWRSCGIRLSIATQVSVLRIIVFVISYLVILTARRKQGGSQSVNDNAKGNAKSAGAQLRRYGEQALRDVSISRLFL